MHLSSVIMGERRNRYGRPYFFKETGLARERAYVPCNLWCSGRDEEGKCRMLLDIFPLETAIDEEVEVKFDSSAVCI